MADAIAIQVGQTWEDKDPRVGFRVLRVVEVGAVFVWCSRGGRTVRIRQDRLTKAYRLVPTPEAES